jgi:hypothetical protein
MRRSHQSVCTAVVVLIVSAWCGTAFAQTVTVVRDVNLRTEQSSQDRPIRLLTSDEPPMTLVEPHIQDGYYHVQTRAGEEGYVYARSVKVSIGGPTPPTPVTIPTGPGLPGSASMLGCGDSRWQHVYNPTRLTVRQDCLTITGVIVDATAPPSQHQLDGVKHEPDGDTHGWLRVDPPFASLINAGNTSDEGGNLVFEIVCHYTVTQPDAVSACAGFTDHTTIPSVGSHVAITGTFVTEKNHKKWNEIHPVSSIRVQ